MDTNKPALDSKKFKLAALTILCLCAMFGGGCWQAVGTIVLGICAGGVVAMGLIYVGGVAALEAVVARVPGMLPGAAKKDG